MILITGASGFIGRHLVKALLSQTNYRLVACFFSHPILSSSRVKTVQIDLSDSFQFKNLPHDKVNLLIHLASYIPEHVSQEKLEDFEKCLRINIQATKNVLEYCRLTKIKRLIYASTISVYGPTAQPPSEDHACFPQTFYGISKLAAELLCEKYHRTYGLDYISLRFSSVYGLGQNPNLVVAKFIQNALEKKPLHIWSKREKRIDFIYIKDVVQAIFCALDSHRTGVYNIGTGKAITVKELAEKIKQVFAHPDHSVIYTKKVKGDDSPVWFDTTKAKRELGFEANFSILEGLKDYKRELVQQIKNEK